ncbi:MAG TPA: glycoside hydrolase family 2 TIM barrel-domain containing protein [Phycisphaerae bacterium]|jgi:hypothetical protein
MPRHIQSLLLPTALLLAAAILPACSPHQLHRSDLAQSPGGEAREFLLNKDWRFILADTPGAEMPDFKDAAWRTLNLPHDWSIEQPFDQNLASGTGFLPGGIAWYRKHFTLPLPLRDKNITVRFDGVYKNAAVYINGYKLGQRPSGYSSFEYDLTPYLTKLGDNVLAVRVDHHDFADSRWYPGSGIYRNVYLAATGDIHVGRYGTFITTPDATEKSATINIQTAIDNVGIPTSSSAAVTLTTRIYDPSHVQVAQVTSQVPPNIFHRSDCSQQITLTNPTLWSLDHPGMYSAITEVKSAGTTLDVYQTPFGIRTFKFDPNSGFSLNGTPMKLKGVCLHEDAGALGSAVPPQVWERRLRILKDAGTNAIRCSHNPPDPAFLDLCDKMGFLVMDEAFDEWSKGKKKWMDYWASNTQNFSLDGYNKDFDQWSDIDIADMVLRDRNHPSIIMWSIGNEIDYSNDPYPPNSPELKPIADRLIKDIKDLDTTRPVTAACAAIATNTWYKDLDIIGYNYQESRYAADHAAMPDRVIFGSENGMDFSAWQAVANNPYISAQFLWTGIDYNGEANKWPNRSRPDGFLDLAAFPKPMFYFRKSLWNDAPMVKIDQPLPQKDSTPTGLVAYTNCDAVELFQNHVSLGEIPVPANHMVPILPTKPANAADNKTYLVADPAAGPIRILGKKADQPLAQDTFTQPGTPSTIYLSQYHSEFGPGDGPNVAQVELSLLDSSSNLATSAGDQVTISLEGPGKLLAIESGDPDSHENYQAPTHKAFHGRLLLYIETHGNIQLTAKTSTLSATTMINQGTR